MERKELLLAKIEELKEATGQRAEWLAEEIREEMAEYEEVGARAWIESNPRKAVALVGLVALVVGGLLALVF